jgi:hypothetical protein
MGGYVTRRHRLLLKTIGLPGKGEVDGLHVQEFCYPGGSNKCVATAAAM